MEFYILNGVISKSAEKLKKVIGKTDLLHIVKQMLTRLNVPFVDVCCPDTGFSPVRRNNDTNTLEFFNFEDQVWEEYVPTP